MCVYVYSEHIEKNSGYINGKILTLFLPEW